MEKTGKMQKKTLVIYGPTVTGKTGLAIKIAKKYDGEVISADSRQVYKSLDIGTGKTSFNSKVRKHNRYWIVDGVKIHGFDLIEPGVHFSSADFIKFAKTKIAEIHKSHKLPIIAGGTGFYIKSLLYGLDSIGIKENKKLREKLDKLSVNDLYEKLKEIYPQRAKFMNESDQKNPRRLIRAIEIAGIDFKQKTTNYELLTINYLLIGLTAPNDFLYKKADLWLNERIKQGLIDEVKLLVRKINPEWLISLGLEYRWLTRLVKGDVSKREALKRLNGDIHNLIRRQKTWFRQFKNIKTYDVSQVKDINLLEKDIDAFIKQDN